MKVGVLGGTFDPPHLGHLEFARIARESLGLDEVLFVPANRNPLKQSVSAVHGRHRLAMVQAMVEKEEGLGACDIEIQKGGLSYTVETMTELSIANPAEYWFLVGIDAIKTFQNWKQPHRLVKLCRFGVALRPPYTFDNLMAMLPEEIKSKVDIVPMKPLDYSSSAIRSSILVGKPVGNLIHPKVQDYIKRNNLYRTP